MPIILTFVALSCGTNLEKVIFSILTLIVIKLSLTSLTMEITKGTLLLSFGWKNSWFGVGYQFYPWYQVSVRTPWFGSKKWIWLVGWKRIRPLALNIWGRYKLVEIWWHVLSDEFVLHIFSSFNRSLSSGALVSFQIYPVLASFIANWVNSW